MNSVIDGSLLVRERAYRLAMPGVTLGESWLPVSGRDLGFLLVEWRRLPEERWALRAALHRHDPFEVRGLSDDGLLDLLEARLREGWWQLYREATEELSNRPPPEGEVDTEAHEEAVEEPKHDVYFEVVYPDGSPAPEWAYRLTDPDGNPTEGKVPSDGIIEEHNVPEGTYLLDLKEARAAAWQTEDVVRVGVDVELRADVSGFADGTAAKVRVFRMYRERDGDELASLDATVHHNTVSCTFRYDDAADEERQGRTRLIAEVSLEDGAYWVKTSAPLVVQLKTFRKARWKPAVLHAAEPTELVAHVPGFSEGTSATITLFRKCPIHGPSEVTVVNATVEEGTLRYPLLFAQSSEPEDPILEGDRIQQPGEYFAQIVLEEGVRREVVTNLLVCRGDRRAVYT